MSTRAPAGVQKVTSRVRNSYERTPPRRRLLIASGVVAAGAALGALPFILSEEEKPRARQYTAFKSCLLTGPAGISEEPAASVWKGMQEASLENNSKVQYLADPDDKSTHSFAYLGTLLQNQCDLIFATGPAATNAVTAGAATHPGRRFIVVGAPATTPGTTSISGSPQDLSRQVAATITDAG